MDRFLTFARPRIVFVLSAILLCFGLTFSPNSKADSASWTGSAGVTEGSGPAEDLTGVQIYRYDSIPSNVAIGAGNCSTLLGSSGNISNQPYVYQDVVIPFTFSGANFDDYFGTIHQCLGYEWWFFVQEYDSPSGPMFTNEGDQSISGSNEHHFYEFINNSSGSDVMAAQVDSTVKWTAVQHGVLGTATGAETVSTSEDAVTTYQGSNLNYVYDFGSWTSYDMSSSDTYNTDSQVMCSYVVSPPGSQVANFGENTSNMTNCT